MPRPVRILSIAHSYVVGVNRRLAHEIARAAGDRFEITAVAPEYFHGGNDLRPVRFQAERDEPIHLRAVGAHFTRSPHLFFYGKRLRRLLVHGGFDLVHVWEEPYVLAGAQVARWTPPNVPLLFWTAQNHSKKYPPPFAQFERACVRRCAGWMACGRTTVDALAARDGYALKPHRIIPLGVDVDRFKPDRSAGERILRELHWSVDGPPVVGYLGRFVPEKGLPLLMNVLDALRTPWRAMFVGTGALEPPLRAFASRHGDRVRICNDVDHDDVSRHLNAMDVLCAPSQTTPKWREQFGRMLVEAFACGVAVIGSDSGEIPFVIENAGVICGERDEAAWVTALSALLENPNRRAEWAERGLARARENYAWPIIGRAHVEFFDEILRSASREHLAAAGTVSR